MAALRSSGDNGGDDDADISIIGPKMTVVGDLETEGTVRVEGRVEGNVRAGKAVVIGESGEIEGDVRTQDSVISGKIEGSVTAASRLEVQASAEIDGEIHARRMQLEEGAVLNGTVRMGEVEVGPEASARSARTPARTSPVPTSEDDGEDGEED